MPSSNPPIPHRQSSLEPSKPTPPKKRMSLTSNPILSMLGLGRTSSAPAIPSGERSDQPTSPASREARTTSTKPSDLPAVVDKPGLEDDQKTEVDETEHMVMEEPEYFEFDHEHSSRSTVPEPKVKGKLTLDIPAPCFMDSSHPSTVRQDRDSTRASPEKAAGEEDVLKELGDNQTKRCHGRTPQSPESSTKGVWLCSRPQLSGPSSPIDENGNRRRSIGRPLVVRAMSTGRLAREFDEEGRVVSLSTHCERVLNGRPVASSPTRMEQGEELRRTVSVANALTPTRAGITRSQTSHNVLSSSPSPSRRKSVEAGFRRLENVGSGSKRGSGRVKSDCDMILGRCSL